MDDEFIVIKLKSGDVCHYKPEEYDDYYYDKKVFVVMKEKRWIGIYNIDCVEYIEIAEG